jgi:hypothetical protein
MSNASGFADTKTFPLLLFPITPGATKEARAVERETAKVVLRTRLGAPRFAATLGELSAVARESGLYETEEGRLTLRSAEAFLAALPRTVPMPEVSVDPDGEIALDWSLDDDMLSVSVGPSGRLTYVWDVDGQSGSQTDRFSGALPKKLVERLGAFAE